MKPILYLFVPLVLSSSIAAATSCNDYEAGGVVCTGPNGYSSTQHNYSGGTSTYQDSYGNSASIHRYQGGGTVIVPGSTGTPPPTFVPPGMDAYPRPGAVRERY